MPNRAQETGASQVKANRRKAGDRRREVTAGIIAVLAICIAGWEVLCRYRLHAFQSELSRFDTASLADHTGKVLLQFDEPDQREIILGLQRAQFRGLFTAKRPLSFRLRLSRGDDTLLIPVVALGEGFEVPGGFVADPELCRIMHREIMKVLRELHEQRGD